MMNLTGAKLLPSSSIPHTGGCRAPGPVPAVRLVLLLGFRGPLGLATWGRAGCGRPMAGLRLVAGIRGPDACNTDIWCVEERVSRLALLVWLTVIVV